MKKRIFALLLALVLLSGVAPGMAPASYALDEEDPAAAGESAQPNTDESPGEDSGLEVFDGEDEDAPDDWGEPDLWGAEDSPDDDADDDEAGDWGAESELPAYGGPAGGEPEYWGDPPPAEEDPDAELEMWEADEDLAASGTDTWNGDGSRENPYQLSSGADFETLQQRVNDDGEDYSGVYFKMTGDVTLPDGWTGVGCLAPGASDAGDGANIRPFSGTLDGGGYTLTVPEDAPPLFGFVRGASVSNMRLYGPRIDGDGLVNNYCVDYYGPGGGAAGTAFTVIAISGVTILSGTQTLRSGFIGGLTDGGWGNQYSQTSADNLVYITNCTVQQGVVIGYDGSQSDIGSFAGQLNGAVTGCVSYATVKGKNNVGGIVGSKSTSMGDFSVSNCQFYGSIDASGSNVGGIVGSGYDHETAPNARAVCIENCTAGGTVKGKKNVGGIFGSEGGLWQAWDNGIAYIRGNVFEGTVSGSSCVGGVLGYYRSLNRYTVIENNRCFPGCGTDRGIGSVLYVDADMYANGSVRPLGWKSVSGWPDNIYCFDSAEDDLDRIKYALNPDGPYYNIAKKNHQRSDDPLGADLDSLVTFGAPAAPYTVSITVSGDYKKEYLVGEKLDLTGAVFTVKWSDNTVTHPQLKEVKVSKLDSSEPGTKTITISYGTVSTTIKVTVKKPDGKIKVTFSILGDYPHDSDTDGHVHGLSMGGLTTWVAPKTWEANSNETVWDLMQRVMEANGITAKTTMSLGTVYVAGLTYKGTYLGEFTNGVNSGWQYTVNGHHPLLGVAQQYLSDKDKIIFHYTDDYTREEGSEGYDDEDQKAADKVIKLIDAIPLPITLDCKAAIEAARAAYDALKNYNQRSKVTNYQKLLDAEKELERLEEEEAERHATEEDKKAAAAVDKLIQEAEDEEGVKTAREAYEKLTEKQKKLVKYLWLLEQKERELAAEKARARYRDIYEETARYIESLGDMDASSQWTALGFARSGRKVSEGFYQSMVEAVLASINEKEQLHRAKSSDNSRTILVLTALGYDVTDVGGHDLLRGLTDLDYVKKQGINGPIWALIALDSHGYELPEDPDAADHTTREKIIAHLLANQLPDGGWALTGELSDSDITGMCLQALAPYYHKRDDVTAAVDRALETLSAMQNADGSYSAFGSGEGLTPTSESTSQILVALSALGIDPETDERFLKNGHSPVEALCAFFIDGGGFSHLMGHPRDGMATEQGYYALTAYFRMLEGKTALYDMSDVEIRRASAPAGADGPAESAPESPAVGTAGAPAEETEPESEDIALAVSAAAREEEKGLSPLLWAVPGVGFLGLLTWWLDKIRRARKH